MSLVKRLFLKIFLTKQNKKDVYSSVVCSIIWGKIQLTQGISKSLNHYLVIVSAVIPGYKKIKCLTLFSLKDKQDGFSCNTGLSKTG